MYDIIIIGAGPAGLTSAIYSSRSNKKTLVLEGKNYGGQIINSLDISNYPAIPHISGYDFATNLYNQAKELGAEIIFEKVLEIKNFSNKKLVITKNNTYETQAIIIATGANNRKLGLPNEEKYIGKGISYCATCDGAFYKEKVVAVIGGGYTALEEVLYLANIAKKVYLVHRNQNFKSLELLNKLKEKANVEFVVNSNITKINGQEFLESITVTDNSNNEKTLEIAGLFIAIGHNPATEEFSSLIKLDKKGYVVSNEKCHTNISGVFVAGDNRAKEVRQLVTATSDGAISAIEALNYLNEIK